MEPLRFEGRTAFITGATRGIGKCIALELARHGCNVVVTGKTVDENPKLPGTIGETVREIQSYGREALGIQLDVRDDRAIEFAVQQTMTTFGRIDFLVNNAGALYWQPLIDTALKKFDLVMGVNARAAFACAHHVLPVMRRQRYGHIIMMSPPVSDDGAAGKIAYAISKYGMTMIAQGLAEEEAQYNIACNALWPATMIETAAVTNNNLGSSAQWRMPQIVADAVLRIFSKQPQLFTGNSLIDEDFLRAEGVTDFSHYRCDPDHEPPHIPFSFKV